MELGLDLILQAVLLLGIRRPSGRLVRGHLLSVLRLVALLLLGTGSSSRGSRVGNSPCLQKTCGCLVSPPNAITNMGRAGVSKTLTVSFLTGSRLGGVKVTALRRQARALDVLLPRALALALGAETLLILSSTTVRRLLGDGTGVTAPLVRYLADGLGARAVELVRVLGLVEGARVVDVRTRLLSLTVCGQAGIGVPDIGLGRLEACVARGGWVLSRGARALGLAGLVDCDAGETGGGGVVGRGGTGWRDVFGCSGFCEYKVSISVEPRLVMLDVGFGWAGWVAYPCCLRRMARPWMCLPAFPRLALYPWSR